MASPRPLIRPKYIQLMNNGRRNNLQFSANIFQVFMKVPLIIHTHKISALHASTNGPGEVMLIKQFPLLFTESSSAPYNGQQAHRKPHLLKLNNLQRCLPNQVSRKLKKGMPEVMHFTSSHCHIGQFICLHEPHRRSIIWWKLPRSHKPSIGSTERVFRQVPSMSYVCRNNTRALQ